MKTQVSAGFAKFASKTTAGAYDEARKADRMTRGIPFEVGTTGVATVHEVICDETKPDNEGIKYPRLRVELKIHTPETYRGKKLSGPGLMQTIKDGRDPSKWSKHDAWNATLGMLESLGCPESITQNYEDFQEVLDWFDEKPRYVNFTISDRSYTNAQGKLVPQKGIDCIAVVPEEDSGNTPEYDTDPDAKYVMYRGTKHKVASETKDTYDLISLATERPRNGVSKDDCEPC